MISGTAKILAAVFVFLIPVWCQPADLVVVNAQIRSMDPRVPEGNALAVRAGRFVFVGSSDGVAGFIGPQTVVVDARNELVYPGFNDSHIHLANVGLRLFSIDLTKERNAADAVARRVRFVPVGQWIGGGGWDSENMPALQDLDTAAPDHPVFLYGRNPRFAVANSAALRLARITGANLPLSGTDLVRLRAMMPDVPSRRATLEAALNEAAAFGVTSVQDVSADDLADELRGLERDGKLKLRVYDCVGPDQPRPTVDRRAEKLVRTGCIKSYSDGDRAEIPTFAAKLAAADRAGIQILLHAIGPRANTAVLDIFERIVRANGRADRRFRVEHAHNFRTADLRRFLRLPAIASMQPALFDDGSVRYRSIFKSLRQAGVGLAFGSDASMIPVDPLAGIRAASGAGGIDIDEAVFAYTAGAAYAEFQESEKGSITVGKLADFVIVENSRSGPVRVAATYVDGRRVYSIPDGAGQLER